MWSVVSSAALEYGRIDADYYQPTYLIEEQALLALADRVDVKPLGKLVREPVRTGRTPSDREFQTEDQPIYFIKTNTLRVGQIIFEQCDKIPARVLSSHEYLQEGEVLVTIIGATRDIVGRAAIYPPKAPSSITNQNVAVIRVSQDVSPFFFQAYLNSKYGQHQLWRHSRQTEQVNLNCREVERILVPVFGQAGQEKVAGLVQQAIKVRNEAKSLYTEAEALLLAELGLDELDLSHQPTYTQSFSQAWGAGRLDAEYFQPKYYQVLDAIQSLGPQQMLPLGEIVTMITNGHTPLRHDLSVGEVPFITAEFLSDFRVNYDGSKRILREHHETELQRTALREGDLLVTIKGRIGNAAVVAHLPGDVNINQDVALLRLKKGYHPYYVAAFLNSEAGKALTDQVCTGQINPFLGLGNLKKVPVPIFEAERMNRIGDRVQELVEAAYQAEQEANRLLEEAKRRVEEMVLGEG
jgi:type I restriction enzyme S subunit